ncbi:MAG: pirin family protein [Burkholderiaceae bacterium]|nr:pirin family protein [Burkholderiaceae bacterium]
MITLRKSAERGHADHGWLESFHSFSFAEYHDPRYMGVGNLRVINEDRVAPGTGFGSHGHRDMEIVSYVLEGALGHRDSLGQSATIRPGDVQRMSAGSGIRHSEFNVSRDVQTHFLQIWILPDALGIAPGYEQIHIADDEKRGRLRRIASPQGGDGAVRLHADATLYAGLFDAGEAARMTLDAARHTYVQLARGTLVANGIALAAGDALHLQGERELTLEGGADAEVIVFDLAP